VCRHLLFTNGLDPRLTIKDRRSHVGRHGAKRRCSFTPFATFATFGSPSKYRRSDGAILLIPGKTTRSTVRSRDIGLRGCTGKGFQRLGFKRHAGTTAILGAIQGKRNGGSKITIVARLLSLQLLSVLVDTRKNRIGHLQA
jgi:hypothetical protein